MSVTPKRPRGSSRFLTFAIAVVTSSCVLMFVYETMRPGAPGTASWHATACPGVVERAGLLATEGSIKRRALYNDMEVDFGRQVLQMHGSHTQGLHMSDIFDLSAHPPVPRLQSANPPVRAVVAPFLGPEAAQLQTVVASRLAVFAGHPGLWPQNASLYHATVWHASPHQHPVPATPEQVQAEVEAVRGVAGAACPMQLILERVVATGGGVVLACWQISGGTEVAALRASLAQALPRAPPPEQQTVREPAILYTTLARVLARPEGEAGPGSLSPGAVAQALDAAVHLMTTDLCGLRMTIDQLWLVEERDLLALALNGDFLKHSVELRCPP